MSKLILLLALLVQEAERPRRAFADLPADGVPAIAGQAVPWKDLAAALKRHAASGVRELILRVDGSVPFSSVQSLMAAAREAGIEGVRFSTEKALAPLRFSDEARRSVRIKVREGAKGLELLVLQEASAVSLDDLRAKLKGLDKMPIVVDADFEVPYGAVRQIVSACSEEGFDKVSFAGAPRKTGAIRMLYAEHAPRAEFRYLRNLLERSPDFSLDVYLATADPDLPGILRTFPRDLTRYDAILMGGLKPLDAEGGKALVDHVERGGGVVWMAAELPAGEWIGNALESICPVKLAYAGNEFLIPPSLRLSVKEAGHRLTQGLPWEEMSGRNHTLWTAGQVDPDALMLVESHPAGGRKAEPFLVTQTLGRGRAAFVGALDTFEWRREVGDLPAFAPFWTGLLKWAAGR